MTRPRIGVLTTSYPSGPDDPAGHFVAGFSRWLQRHVADVEVLALGGEGGAARLAAGGLPERLAGAAGIARAGLVTARLLAAAGRRQHRYAALVSHWVVPSGAVGALVAGRRRHLVVAHGSDLRLLEFVPGGAAAVRALARRAELVYVAEAQRVRGAPGRVVPMPAPVGQGPPTEAERLAARAALGLPADPHAGPLVVLCLARLVPGKGVDLLLDALPDGVVALVAGEGPERARLAQHPAAAAGRARLLGLRVGPDKRALLAAADVLVVPSRLDGSPTVIPEAQAVGLPVLATRVGGIPERLTERDRSVDATVHALRAALASLREERPRRSHGRDSMHAGADPWRSIGPILWAHPGRRLIPSDEDPAIFWY